VLQCVANDTVLTEWRVNRQEQQWNDSPFCVLQCDAVCCSLLQFVALCCSILQFRQSIDITMEQLVFLCVAVCCSVLQCVAV